MAHAIKNSLRFPKLKTCFLFQDVNEQEVAHFIDACSVKFHSYAENIVTQGELPPGLFLIASGSVEIICHTEAGDRAIITHLAAGDTVGEPELIAQMPCVCSAVAHPDTVTLFSTKSDFKALMGHEAVVRNVMRYYVERLRRDNRLKAIDQFQPVEQRIASYLLHLSDAHHVLRVSQAYLANAAGCSRQTVNRVLGKLKEEGVLEIRKGSIQILRPDELLHLPAKAE